MITHIFHYLSSKRERASRQRNLRDLMGAQHKQKEKSWPPRTRINENQSLAKSSSVTPPADETLTTNRCSCFNERERGFAAGRSSSSQMAS